jgi:hypothetical protein
MKPNGVNVFRYRADRSHVDFPILVLAFNRPEYLSTLLSGLKNQSLEVKDRDVFFFLDSFEGSKDQFLGREDKSLETLDVCNQYFPNSSKVVHSVNLGIAYQYRMAEECVFKEHKYSHALFLE